MRKALIVGIDYYQHLGSLSGCVNDASSVCDVLARHDDGRINFEPPKLLLGKNPTEQVRWDQIRENVRELFADKVNIALFYFAGHGYADETGGYLCASDSPSGVNGLPIAQVMTWAMRSPADNRIVILDCCQSGAAGNRAGEDEVAEIRPGMTILSASTDRQFAKAVRGGDGGVFTHLLIDAMKGAAADVLGDVTMGSIYAHVDQALGAWSQRPVFKTHVKEFVVLREAAPSIRLEDLKLLPTDFPTAEAEHALDPAYERFRSREQSEDANFPTPDPMKIEIFARLQRCNRVNLVVPVGTPHMWHAAMESRSCRLTALGRHYWRLAHNKLI